MTREPLIDLCIRLRGWGTPDPRTADALAHENQPGWTLRSKAVRKRAIAAGHPATVGQVEANKIATAAVLRLEGTDFTWNGERHHDMLKVAAAEERSPRRRVTVTTSANYWQNQHDDGLPSIFDE